jgi:hypothetical protein
LNIFPNPLDDILNIEFNLKNDEDVEVEVVDMLGKTVFKEAFTQMNSGFQSIQITLNDTKAGIYLLNVQIGDSNHIERISIQ